MSTRSTTRGFQPLRDLPTVLWLALLVLVVVAHRDLPAPRWLMLHVLLLGAATHAILVWSQYFSFALLRTKQTTSDRTRQTWRLGLANAGAAVVVVGVPLDIWPLTVAGATLLIAAVAWHGASLVARLRGALAGRFGHSVRYYVAAAAFLIVGAGLGTWLAGGAVGIDHAQLMLAHALVNLLGWVGLTVAGTLVTLWPTMLRTRADEHAGPASARALPVLAIAAAVAAIGAGAGQAGVLAVGLFGYAAGLSLIAVGMVRAARTRPPRSFAAGSAGIAVLWGIGCLLVLATSALAAWSTGAAFTAVQDTVDAVVPFVAAGLVAQVLIGALSYLVPVVLGGGPTPVRIGTRVFDRGAALRIATANVALVVCALPVSSLMRVVASVLYLVAAGAFLPLLLAAMRAQRRAKRAQGSGAGQGVEASASGAGAGSAAAQHPRGPIAPEGERPTGQRAGQAVAGLLAVVLAVVVAAAVQPQDLGLTAAPGVAVAAEPDAGAAAPVQTVEVVAAAMRFTPSRIDVPAGTRLVIELTNADAELEHDLVLATGVRSPRLAPGEHARIDLGIVSGDVEAWCSVIGHRQMGMTLAIVVTGADGAPHHDRAADGEPGTGASDADADAVYDPSAEPSDDFRARDAALPALPRIDGPVTHRVTLAVTEHVVEVAPGVRQTLWTFGGTAPGPTLHGRVGDRFEITLVNDGTIGHSIDFHAGALAPDAPMRTIRPGERLTYAFTAEKAGIWMYHCATTPMSAHIANGMFGAVVIEPDDLPAVDRSYLLVQSELYLGAQGGEVDVEQLGTGLPDIVAFNGYARQYEHAPLPARVGERVRVWLLDAGVARPTSFHVVGGQFDTTWAEGTSLLDARDGGDGGSQALALQPAQGGFVELEFPEAGRYPFLSHVMIDADRGAQGTFAVTE